MSNIFDVIHGFPPIKAWTPQELLPIMPPSVHLLCASQGQVQSQFMLFSLMPKGIEHYTRLNAGPAS